MPVHNALPYLDQAVESILAQTLADFEFVILDDASTDGSTERLREWASKDRRIRLIEVREPLGPVLSSNRVAAAALAPIVARMDADDISYPDRLAEQVKVLDAYPEVGVVGGLVDIIDHDGNLVRRAEPWRLGSRPVTPPFGNGPMTYRREVFDRIGGFRKQCEYWEDQDLLVRLAAVSKVAIVPRALYKVRQSKTSTRLVSEPSSVEHALDLMYRSRDQLEQGHSYEELLAGEPTPRAKIDPRVFIVRGTIVLWAGERPGLFRRLLRYGDLKFNRASATALIWTAWASGYPASLRAGLRMLFVARKLYGSTRGRSDALVYWSPSGITPASPPAKLP